MDKVYDPNSLETQWYDTWEANGYFKPSGNGDPFCIVLPPPNVTGTLHMGHGFQDTLMDTLIRYHRMLGDNTLWQMGTDHAGIATQMVVERQLNLEGKTRHDLGREKFIERIWNWKEQSGNTIKSQIKRIGCSGDWSRERFTLSPNLTKAVTKAFIDLYDQGLIYRGKRLVNWDPSLCTAVSDLEVISTEEKGSLWHIRYPLSDGSAHLIVATTRPETLLGDVAVAVHPEDDRYQSLIGKMVKVPLTDREIPIIADEYVEQDFGTGCVKITPAHDFNDYLVGQRHDLPLINILTETASLNENTPNHYQGLDRFEARKRILQDLTELELLEKTQEHTLTVPRCERTHTIIEPYLTDQWFVKTKPLAEPAINAVKQGHVKLVPNTWEKTYFQWLDNIEDWCISRQLWWGHRIPAWYDDAGNIYVGESLDLIKQKYDLNDTSHLHQDDDVLDTWFSSSLWPFSTLGWPEKTADLTQFFPTSVLVTGFDILFFWVARMMMMGLHFTKKVPFKTVYVTGLIRDHNGQKMSKSKGNVLDPIDLIDGIGLEALLKKRTQSLMQPKMAKQIEKVTKKEFPNGIQPYGTDALRFTYCALASTGRDIRFDMSRLEGYRNFCNKLWNASRYVLMNTEDQPLIQKPELTYQTLADQWILMQLNKTIELAHQHFKEYRFDLLANCLYEFTWNEYCDWYLELSKPILLDKTGNPKTQNATRYTLLYVLETILRLLHPLMPYITEAIWQRVVKLIGYDPKPSIMLVPYPEINQLTQEDQTAFDKITWLKQVITAIRSIRSEIGISPATQISLLLQRGSSIDQHNAMELKPWLITLAKIDTIDYLELNQTPPPSATAVVDSLDLLIPMQGLIDKTAEITRVEKKLVKLNKELTRIESKLQNPHYVKKAPVEIVNQEKSLLAELQQTIERLNKHLDVVQSL